MDRIKPVAERARRQAGLISRHQLLALGISDGAVSRALASGALSRARAGIYRLPGAPMTLDARLWEALLWSEFRAVFSHRTAAWWFWKLDGLGLKPPSTLELVTSRSGPRGGYPGIRIRQSAKLTLGVDTVVRNGMPCTSLARTLIDLAAVLSPEALEQAVDSARRRDGTVEDDVYRRLDALGHQGRTGTARAAAVVAREPQSKTGSALEIKTRNVMTAGGIPNPMAQLQMLDSNRHQIAVADFAWPKNQVVLFCQSGRWHSSRNAFQNDNRISTTLTSMGWRVLTVTFERLEVDREGFLNDVRAALALPWQEVEQKNFGIRSFSAPLPTSPRTETLQLPLWGKDPER